MTVNEEITSFWVRRLVKVPSKTLESWPLSPKTRQFLQTIGLPIDPRLQTILYPAFQFTPDDIHAVEYRDQRYLSIGIVRNRRWTNVYWAIGILEDSDDIFLVPPAESTFPYIEYLNSSIQRLVLSLRVYLKYDPLIRALRDQEQLYRSDKTKVTLPKEIRVQQLHEVLADLRELTHTEERELISIDRKAFTTWPSFWNDVFDI